MVRIVIPTQYRTPWMFVKKGEKGQRKRGPYHFEKHAWPGQNREFPEMSPKFQQNNRPELRGYTGVHPAGFVDQKTGKFVHVPEMIPELIVPDLSNCELKPYVSYKTDIRTEERTRKFKLMKEKYKTDDKVYDNVQPEEIWPPPVVNAKFLFDHFYADKIREAYGQELKKKKRQSGRSLSMLENFRKLVQKEK